MAYAFTARSAALACTLLLAASASGVGAEESATQQSPIVLVPHRAIYDLSLGETRGNCQSSTSPAASSTISTATPATAIRWSSARSRSSTPAKARVSTQRSALDDLGRRRRQELQIQLGELRRREPGRFGRRPCRARAAATAVDLIKPEQKALDIDAGRGVSDRAHGAGDQRRPRRQDYPRFSGL